MDLMQQLNIQVVKVTKQEVVLSLKISDQHKQPYGLVHGGINGVLIETACSLGANQSLKSYQKAVGIELQVAHLNAAKHGNLTVKATPEKIGHQVQFWHAEVWLNQKIKTATGQCILMNQDYN